VGESELGGLVLVEARELALRGGGRGESERESRERGERG
jgi:hypothetical protein